jgi:hypothetical protein
MKNRDSSFGYWPEMMRATILTASTHPVDGAVRTTFIGVSDRKQGAGLLNAAAAIDLADSSKLVSGPNNATATSKGRDVQWYDFSSSFPNYGVSDPYNILTSYSGRLRVVITWDASFQSCSQSMDGSGCTTDVLDADLDLWVSKWNGSGWDIVCGSSSWDSSWELCDLAVGAGEQYRASVVLNAANAAGTYIGIAWNNYDPNSE